LQRDSVGKNTISIPEGVVPSGFSAVPPVRVFYAANLGARGIVEIQGKNPQYPTPFSFGS